MSSLAKCSVLPLAAALLALVLLACGTAPDSVVVSPSPSAANDPFLGTWQSGQADARLATVVIAQDAAVYRVTFYDRQGSPYLRWTLPRHGDELSRVVNVGDGALKLAVVLHADSERLSVSKGARWSYELDRLSDATSAPSSVPAP